MPRTVKLAAIQMDATPAPTEDRLNRVARFIGRVAKSGAKLVVLPEMFNTGYQYTDENFSLAETLDGETVTWMKAQAAKQGVYLAGALLLRDGADVYNSALLVAPDGQVWRYNKHYPFLWERAFFREGAGITIAETELGKIGLMVSWDAAHPAMWRAYAGKVDLMLVISCPPNINQAVLAFPDGTRIPVQELGPLIRMANTDEGYFAGQDIDDHAAWMGVPVVHTSGGGTFRSAMPLALISTGTYIAARPDLWPHLMDASSAWIEAGFENQTKIVSGTGTVLARSTAENDGYCTADVELADEPPAVAPRQQPYMRTPVPAYLLADVLGPAAMMIAYRQGIWQQWDGAVGSFDLRPRIRSGLTFSSAVMDWVVQRVKDRV